MSAPELRQMVFRISIRYVHLSKQQIVDLQACKLGVIMVIAVSCVKLLSALAATKSFPFRVVHGSIHTTCARCRAMRNRDSFIIQTAEAHILK